LPPLDVMQRQHRVMGIFDEMRQSRRPIDANRVAAIQFLDTALAADRRQMIKQYVENVERAARVADRAWQAAQELSQGFVYAYQTSLERALAERRTRGGSRCCPRSSRGCCTTTAPTRSCASFRHERWIPAKVDRPASALRARSELGVDQVAVALPSAGPAAMQWSTEQEYTYALSSSSSTPATCRRPRSTGRARSCAPGDASSSSRRCREPPRASTSISRASAGCAPHRRRIGPMLRYLDTTPLFDQLERAIHALRQTEIGDPARRRRDDATDRRAREDPPRRRAEPARRSAQSPRVPMTVAAKVACRACAHLRRAHAARHAEPANDPDAGLRADRSLRRRRQPARKPRVAERRLARVSIGSFADPDGR
jgi:hypothetical protein